MFGWFWKESFWLPANTTWDDVSNGPEKTVVYAEVKDFWFQIPLVVVVLLLRFLSERYVFSPLGRFLKISDLKIEASPNVKLEPEYKKSSTCKNVTALAKQLDLSERQIRRWWRLRRGQGKPTTLIKFCENMWKSCHYLLNLSLGIYVAWGQDWVKDVEKCMEGYPHQGVTSEIWWYYMVVAAYYICLIITQFRDVRRKDFWQMFTHHLVTIGLIFTSWICQFFRMGCLVQILHEMASIMLEIAKAAKYAGLRRIAMNALFAVFMLVWVVARLVLYPVFILPTVYRYRILSPLALGIFILLTLLLVLSCFWTCLIFVALQRTIYSGEVPTDVRSSESEESDASTEQN